MKFQNTNFKLRMPSPAGGGNGRSAPVLGRSNGERPIDLDFSEASARFISLRPGRAHSAGFTMIEIAICLAIIGFALVAIIGVLPYGMNTQRDNREETVINQDATVLLEAIRSGARGMDSLTNSVYAITNYRATYNGGTIQSYSTIGWDSAYSLTSGANIVGILSTPEFTDFSDIPQAFTPVNGYSNHIIAYVRSMSGLAAEKPPQDNQIMRDDSFTYRVYCVNAAVASDTNSPLAGFSKQLNGNLHELRLTFLWPQLPNGNVGGGRQTFRASVAGQLAADPAGSIYFYYRPQYFNTAP